MVKIGTFIFAGALALSAAGAAFAQTSPPRALSESPAAQGEAEGDKTGMGGDILSLEVNGKGSSSFYAYRGEISIRTPSNNKIRTYRWGGSACPGKDLTSAQVDILVTALANDLSILPFWQPGAGSNNCLVRFRLTRN